MIPFIQSVRIGKTNNEKSRRAVFSGVESRIKWEKA